MTDAPEVQRGDTGNIMAPSLPQGEATALNENAAEGQAAAAQIAANDPKAQSEEDDFVPHEIEYADPEDATPTVPPGETDQMLFGPTDRPQEPITTGHASVGPQPAPRDVAAWLPTLREAAEDPDAPESLKNMYRLVVHHMNKG